MKYNNIIRVEIDSLNDDFLVRFYRENYCNELKSLSLYKLLKT